MGRKPLLCLQLVLLLSKAGVMQSVFGASAEFVAFSSSKSTGNLLVFQNQKHPVLPVLTGDTGTLTRTRQKQLACNQNPHAPKACSLQLHPRSFLHPTCFPCPPLLCPAWHQHASNPAPCQSATPLLQPSLPATQPPCPFSLALLRHHHRHPHPLSSHPPPLPILNPPLPGTTTGALAVPPLIRMSDGSWAFAFYPAKEQNLTISMLVNNIVISSQPLVVLGYSPFAADTSRSLADAKLLSQGLQVTEKVDTSLSTIMFMQESSLVSVPVYDVFGASYSSDPGLKVRLTLVPATLEAWAVGSFGLTAAAAATTTTGEPCVKQ